MKKTMALCFALALLLGLLCGCSPATPEQGIGNGWEPIGELELQYAQQFSVSYYPDGYKQITLGDGSRFLVVPEGGECPKGMAKDITPLYQPLENLYLAASTAMCLFEALERMDAITLTATKEENWYIESARLAMQEGSIRFAGKYSEPDYELLLDSGCPVAIESLMIGHASQVKEKLEELGIAVFVDQSSAESHPLGRTEWIKLYAALLNEEEKAETLFARQSALLQELVSEESTGTSVVFFHINSSGGVVVRKSTDYVAKMLDLAGGSYVFSQIGDPEKRTSTVNIEMEQFFAQAKEADCIIYNGTLGGEIRTLEELLEKNALLAEFRAVKSGNVWCTGKNFYQETTQFGEMIRSFHTVFSGQAEGLEELPFLTRLR